MPLAQQAQPHNPASEDPGFVRATTQAQTDIIIDELKVDMTVDAMKIGEGDDWLARYGPYRTVPYRTDTQAVAAAATGPAAVTSSGGEGDGRVHG